MTRALPKIVEPLCRAILVLGVIAPVFTWAQIQRPAALSLTAPPIQLGDDESKVRRVLKVIEPLYQSPFAPSRFTLKGPRGIYVDFEHGRVVEVDYTSSASGARLGNIGINTSLADAKAALGSVLSESAYAMLYKAQDGELVQLRIQASEQKIAVIAVVGDNMHPFMPNRPGKIILRNQSTGPGTPSDNSMKLIHFLLPSHENQM